MDIETLISLVKDAAIKVRTALGIGLLEKSYQKALEHELRLNGFSVDVEVPVEIDYRGLPVGEYRLDLMVEDRLILELKAVPYLLPAHEWQLVNYLNLMGIEDGLLINFGDNYQVHHKTRVYNPKIKAVAQKKS